MALSWGSRNVLPFPFSLSLSSKAPKNPKEFFPIAPWVTLQVQLSSQLTEQINLGGNEKFSCCMEGSTDVRLCWTMSCMLRTLEIEEICATTWGEISNDLRTVASQLSQSSCIAPRVRVLGGAPPAARCASSQLLLIKKSTEACDSLNSNTFN